MSYPTYVISLKACNDWLYTTLNDWYSPPGCSQDALEFHKTVIQSIVADEFAMFIYPTPLLMLNDPILSELEPYKPSQQQVEYLRNTLRGFMAGQVALLGGIRNDIFYNINWVGPDDLMLEAIPENTTLSYQYPSFPTY